MSPDGHCFSFDSRGNGYVRCEGAGIVVLKPLRAAQAAGDRIYAVIRGCGVNHDGAKPAITNPRGEMQQELLERVCRASHTDPATVAYAEAHGTGTVAGDKTEAKALSGAFCKERRAAPLLIGSLKSNFGHMEGAAGVASVVKAALCVFTGTIPATIKVQQRNPNILWEAWQLDLPLEAMAFPEAAEHPRRAVVSSFGIGGTNACFILEQAPSAMPCALHGSCVNDVNEVSEVNDVNEVIETNEKNTTNEVHTSNTTTGNNQTPSEFILLWSAKTETASRAVSRQLLALWTKTQDHAALQSLCWTMATHRTLLPERSAVVGDAATIATALQQYSDGTPCRDVFHATALEHATRPICFVFCGQGAQWRGMGKDCLETLPVFRDTLLECARVVKKLGGWDLLAAMDGEEANTTRVSQPATTAVQLALVEQLRAWGVVADAAAGHSSGEIGAAYTAGAVTLEEAMELAYYRGSTIAALSGEAGGMAAVGLSETQLAPYLAKYARLVVGCYNSPGALTVSGDKAQLEALCAELQRDGVFCRPLVVTHAFHSSFMEPAMPAYRDAIQHVKGRALHCRLFSSLRGEELTDAVAIDAEYFVQNLTRPVRFPDAVGHMSNAFPQAVFLEIGPHPALHRPVVQCLKAMDGADARVLGTLDRRVAGPTAMRKCVAGLACCGCAVRTALEAFIPPCARYVGLPHYPFERKPLWFESEQSFRFRCPRLDHPLLGVPQMTPLPTWENDLNVEVIPWVQDHVVSDSCLAPGAMYLDMALAAGRVVFESAALSLTDCCFLQALVLPAQGHVQLRTTLDPESGELHIYHREAPEDVTRSFAESEKRRWTLHFRCYAHAEAAEWCEEEFAAVQATAEENCTAQVNVETMYHRMHAQGLQFGPHFRSLRQVAVGLEEGVCEVAEHVRSGHGQYAIHPVLLDTVFQSLITVLGDAVGACVPTSIRSLSFRAEALEGEGVFRVVVRKCHKKGVSHSGDVWLCRGQTPCVSCQEVKVVPLSRQAEPFSLTTVAFREVTGWGTATAAPAFLLEGSAFADLIDATPLPLAAVPTLAAPATLLWGVDLSHQSLTDAYCKQLYPVARALLALCRASVTPPAVVVVTQGSLLETPAPENTSLLGLVRALHTEAPSLPLVFLDFEATLSPAGKRAALTEYLTHPLMEYHELAYRRGAWFEPQVTKLQTSLPVFREGGHSMRGHSMSGHSMSGHLVSDHAVSGHAVKEQPVNTITLVNDTQSMTSEQSKNTRIAMEPQWSLVESREGSLDSFHRTELHTREMTEEDIVIRVHYVGLNYKDVMIAVNLLKEDAFAGGRSGITIGLEASGVVERVGAKVTNVKVGDEVFGLLDHGIATHSTTEACFVTKKPANISLEQGATVFVPYTTAYATIVSLGKVKKGQTVLIHGAAGGVGSGAIQLAHAAGAVVIATVSNQKKEAYVRSLGADVVLNSRSCDFVAGVMEATQQRGCDLVLNCLSGRFMQESLRCLAPFGTFIEIGKTDAMERRTVGVHSFLENGTYIFFDMDRYFAQRDVCVGWIQGMAQCVARGTLKPPPTELYPLKSLSLAMRRLSAARHIGKVVLQLREADGALLPSCRQLPYTPHRLLREDASYLVVGGTGGLGLNVSEWLAEHGARHLLLVSRSGRVHDEDKLVLKRLAARGVDVQLAAVNVADAAALERCLDRYGAEHPPLRGVLHAAMVLRDGLIDSLEEEDIIVSLEAKTQAGWNVHRYCAERNLQLDLFVVFSSISAVVGNLGQSNYCVGNMGLEGLVYHRRAYGLAGCILNLGGVYDAGAVARDGSILNASLREQMISKNDVLRALHVVAQRQSYLVDTPHPNAKDNTAEMPYQIIVFPFETALQQLGDPPIFDSMKWSLASSSVQAEALITQVLQLPPTERRQAIGERVRGDLSAVLGVEGVKNDQSLSSLGVDSILAVELKNRLDAQWSMNLPVFELTSGKTVGDLISTIASHVDKQSGQAPAAPSVKERRPLLSVKEVLAREVVNVGVDMTLNVGGARIIGNGNENENAHDGGNENENASDGAVDRERINREGMGAGRVSDSTKARGAGNDMHSTRDNSTAKLEENVLELVNALKTQLTIKTDFAPRFDWTTTREALETSVYLQQLPWNPYFFTQERCNPTMSRVAGYPDCVNFTSYDYLGLSTSREVIDATQKAVETYGASVSASRLAGGQISLHTELEEAIASFLGVEACIAMLGGHTCNVNAIKCLMSRRDLVLYDELAHNSIIEGAAYSGAARLAFRHNDWRDLERLLEDRRTEFEKVMVCIEGVYSMDGDIPDLPQFIRVKQRFNCILYVDEAHSIGVLGRTGRGIGEFFGVDMTLVDLWMGSLGKAFASAGGYIAGSAVAIEILRYRTPGFVYSIGMPPPSAAAALAAIRQAQKEPWRIERLRERTELFKQLCAELGLDIYDCRASASAVIPVKCGSTERCIEVMKRLRSRGVLVSAGMYPAVANGNARLRFFISANHEESMIQQTVETVAITLKETEDM